MQVLVVADDTRRRDAATSSVQRAGHELCGSCGVADVTAAVRRTSPDLLVVEVSGGGGALRRLVQRAREAAERPIPVLFILPRSSSWLYGRLPADLLPAAAVSADDASGRDVELALARIDVSDAPAPAPPASFGRIAFDRAGGEVRGPAGTVVLTPSEGVILGALLDPAGEVVTLETLAHALWGRAAVDGHAQSAIRSHVHTLRAKLRSAGLDGAVAVLRGFGYRLTESGGG